MKYSVVFPFRAFRSREELRQKTFPPFFHFWLANKRPFKHRRTYANKTMTARTRTGVGAKKFSNKSLNTPGRTLFRGLCNPYSPPLFVHPHPRNNMAGSQYHLCRVKNTLSPSCSIPRRKARLCTTVFPFPRRAIAANLVFHPPHLRGPRRFPFSSIPLSLSILLFPLRVQLSAYNSLKISDCLPARAVTRQQA